MKGLSWIVAMVLLMTMFYVYGVIFFAVCNFVEKLLPNGVGFFPCVFIATGVILAVHTTIFDRNKFNQPPPGAKFNRKDRG